MPAMPPRWGWSIHACRCLSTPLMHCSLIENMVRDDSRDHITFSCLEISAYGLCTTGLSVVHLYQLCGSCCAVWGIALVSTCPFGGLYLRVTANQYKVRFWVIYSRMTTFIHFSVTRSHPMETPCCFCLWSLVWIMDFVVDWNEQDKTGKHHRLKDKRNTQILQNVSFNTHLHFSLLF